MAVSELADRSPLIAEYLGKFGSFRTVKKSFAAPPDPADHPTFRVTESSQVRLPSREPRRRRLL